MNPTTRYWGYLNEVDTPLGAIQTGALVVNVSRGEIVVEPAVLAALESGKLAGYAADVLSQAAETTRDPNDSVLWTAFMNSASGLNLLLTPHIGGTTKEAEEETAVQVTNDVLRRLGIPDADLGIASGL